MTTLKSLFKNIKIFKHNPTCISCNKPIDLNSGTYRCNACDVDITINNDTLFVTNYNKTYSIYFSMSTESNILLKGKRIDICEDIANMEFKELLLL